MKNLTIILISALAALVSCTKSKEVHPEIGDGNDEIVTVGMKDVHVEFTRTDHAGLSRVVFHYCPADANGNAQQFDAAEMTKKETFFELVLDDLICDTLYWYYYELFPNSGDAFTIAQKTFHTQACDTPEPPVAELPTVVTIEVTGITAHSISCIGEVINDGGAEVTERGVCWSTNENPALEDNHVAADTGTGTFTATIEGLEANTTYHLRAYATNEVGTAFGLDKEFVTLSGGGAGEVPEGAINGLFTINENGDHVYFSQGNLQYQASTNTWRFAEKQWNCVGGTDYITNEFYGNVVGSTNNDVSSDYSGWFDLFRWGTSGYNHGAVCYQPWSTSNYIADFFAYGRWNNNLNDENGQADWGYNCISNGGNQENIWRTLSIQEWQYVFYTRNTVSGIRYAKAKVNGVNGLILLPDGWIVSVLPLNNTNEPESGFDSNIISLSQWEEVLEPNGAVFLPVTGYRTSVVCWPDREACYFSSSYHNEERVYYVYFHQNNISVGESEYQCYRYVAIAVRLVQDAN